MRITFTANLQRHVACPSMPTTGATVREALDVVFSEAPPLRAYILDEQGRLRRHVNIFIDDRPVADREGLTDRLAGDEDIFVFQALSGG